MINLKEKKGVANNYVMFDIFGYYNFYEILKNIKNNNVIILLV